MLYFKFDEFSYICQKLISKTKFTISSFRIGDNKNKKRELEKEREKKSNR